MAMLSCRKSHHLKENCYQAKVLSNFSPCGMIVQIVAGRPGLNSVWSNLEEIKNQNAYLVSYLPKNFATGKIIYLNVKEVGKTPATIMPAICLSLPEYLLDADLVDANCMSINLL